MQDGHAMKAFDELRSPERYDSLMEDVAETVLAMLHQEESTYLVNEYSPALPINGPPMKQNQQEHRRFASPRSPLDLDEWNSELGAEDARGKASSSPTVSAGKKGDSQFRERMAMWHYQCLDHTKLSRESGAIAMSYLDRFLRTKAGATANENVQLYQLAGMTCLYIAVKVHEPAAISIDVIARLSCGLFSSQDIAQCEATILTALDWRLNPPTSLGFVRHFLQLVPMSRLDMAERQAAYDICKYLTELAVLDSYFVSVKASTLAYAVLGAALESVLSHDQPRASSVLAFLSQLLLQHSTGLHPCSQRQLQNLQNRLYEAVFRQQSGHILLRPPSSSKSPSAGSSSRSHKESSSPRCIRNQ